MSERFRVLYIEDDEGSAFMITSMLAIHNVDVVWVKDKIELAKELNSQQPNLIICDGKIPCWPGHFDDVIKAAPCKVFMYTGESDAKIKEFLLKGAAAAYVKNHLNTTRLIEDIKKIAYNKNKS